MPDEREAPPASSSTLTNGETPAANPTTATSTTTTTTTVATTTTMPEQTQSETNVVHAVVTKPHAMSDAENTDGDDPLREEIAPDEGLLDDFPLDTEELDLIHLRINSIPALGLDRFPKLTRLCLRENLITELTPLALPHLTELDLYDNRLSHAPSTSLSELKLLENLDLSFNNLRHVPQDLAENHPLLQNLYFVQNKISKITGLEGLKKLKNLELGANRVRVIEGLDDLESLEELWLGKNKITSLSGLQVPSLSNLRILSIQSNRITEIKPTDLAGLTALEELYISHNGLTTLENAFTHNHQLRTIDISSNKITNLTGLSHLRKLEELWASNNLLESFDEVEKELGGRDESKGETVVQTVYLEGNPLQRKNETTYRGKVRLALPEIRQIDATYVR